MSVKDYKQFNALIGAEEEKILKYFGKPTRSLNAVVLYKRDEGILALVFQAKGEKNCVTGLAFFSAAGEFEHAFGIELLDAETVRKAQEVSTYQEKLDILGQPTADIGSGRTVLAYFAKDSTLLTLREAKDGGAKLSVIKLTDKEMWE